MIVNVYSNTKKLEGPIFLADSFFSRFKGLMLKKSIKDEEGIFFEKVNRIHTCFMRFTIDVIYFDENYKVLYIEEVKPWKIGSKVKNARHLLELNRGMGKYFKLGEFVKLER